MLEEFIENKEGLLQLGHFDKYNCFEFNSKELAKTQ